MTSISTISHKNMVALSHEGLGGWVLIALLVAHDTSGAHNVENHSFCIADGVRLPVMFKLAITHACVACSYDN